MVRIAAVDTLSDTVLPSSGTKIRFFCRFGLRIVLPHGLNCVARVRLLYLPPIWVFFPVMSHCFAIRYLFSGAILPCLLDIASRTGYD